MPARLPVEDEQAILRLYALYCHYFNHGEARKWVELFAPDGSFTRLNPSATAPGQIANPAGSTTGHAALMEMALGRREMFRGLVRHQQTDIVLNPGPGPDRAEGISYILLTDWRDGPGKIRAVGDCFATFIRASGDWRFQSIELSTLPLG
ncbi:nuclear transport factor 2 family protein [Paracoccus litorisediminis]|uniref:nuclear transport factor 2 family protein n=1 Tax=Paracoccus litorisediminis TaxID=2006130 RepID=UPI0014792CE8|nr:nuclear transport factor 2 family protein [Paracoccus litorisediminis]